MFFFLIKKLDPRAKIAIILILTILVFITDKLFVTFGLMIVFFLLRFAVKTPFSGVKSFKTLSMLVFFILLLQIFLGPGENYILKPVFPAEFPIFGGMGSLKWDGLFLGLTVSCRMIALLTLLPVFVKTTSPQEIAAGIAGFGFNFRAAFVISSAFNMINFFENEAKTIMDAQKLRGSRSFEEGSFFKKLKAYPSLAVPLVLGAMRKAQAASVCMDSRAFGAYKTRTWLDKPAMKRRDFFSVTVCVLFTAAVLLLNYRIL